MNGVDDVELTSALVEAAPDALVVVDRTGTIARVNAQTERMFGYERAEILGRPIEVLLPEQYRDKHVALRDGFIASPRLLPMGAGRTLVGVRKDGVEISVEVSLSPIHIGDAVWVAASVRDVSDRQQTQRAFEEASQYLRAVVQECPVGLLLVRDRGRRVEANAEAEHILGPIVSGDGNAQLTGRLLWADGTPLKEEERPSVRALGGERVDACELVIRRPDGVKTPVLANAAPLTDGAGNVHGAVVAFEDITALKDLERMRVEWNAIIAHDLRQPLNTIALFAQLASRSAKDDPEVKEPIAQIMSATASLNRMIQDLLDLSRLEAHQLTLRKRPADLAELVSRCVRSTEPHAPNRRFDLRLEKGLPHVELDPGRIEQIITNLLTNAIKYGVDRTPISVGAARRDEGVEVAVTNEGVGIPAEALPRLFQRFQRAADGKLAEVKGVGLGLYITRELIEAHGGRIVAESTPGGTTTFRFTLPVVSPEAAR